jgi:hypothetical protein
MTLLLHHGQRPSTVETETSKARRKSPTHNEEHRHSGPCENGTQTWKESLSLDDVVEEPLLNEDLEG